MKRILLHNWKIKLTCLALAFALWYLIRQNMGEARPREFPVPVRDTRS